MTEQDENDRLKNIAASKEASIEADKEKPPLINENAMAGITTPSNQGYSPSPAEQKANPQVRKYVAPGEVVVPDEDCDPAALEQLRTAENKEEKKRLEAEKLNQRTDHVSGLPEGQDEKKIKEMNATKTLDKTGKTDKDVDDKKTATHTHK